MAPSSLDSRRLQVWLLVQAAVWLPLLAVCAVLPRGPSSQLVVRVTGIAMFPSFLVLLAVLRVDGRPANLVTAGRFAVLLVACYLPSLGANGWLTFAVLALALLGDLVDGAVARRTGPTEAGAVLDMETDQFATLLLAVLAVASGGAAWALLLPAFRYVFVLAMHARGLPAHDPKPIDGDNTRGRRVCAAVLVLLLTANCPAVPPAAADYGTALAVLLLAWSFAGDARHLLRRRVPA